MKLPGIGMYERLRNYRPRTFFCRHLDFISAGISTETVSYPTVRAAQSVRPRLSVSITLYFGTKRKADLDNFNKLSLDALGGIVYEDDSQIAELHLKRAYDKVRPRIEIAI
jgi:hypothetical protein